MSESSDAGEQESSDTQSLAADEAYCSSCGEVIKAEAEICPECGVSQTEGESSSDIPEGRLYELQQLARKDTTVAMLLGFFLTPAAYIMVGKWGWAAINFFTLNYFLLGFIIVPFHVRSMINDAQAQLRAHGEGW